MFPLSLYFSGLSVRWSERQLWANIGASYCADEAELQAQLRELIQPPTAAVPVSANQTEIINPDLPQAITDHQAKQHFSTYLNCIETLAGKETGQSIIRSVIINPGALHPEFSRDRYPQWPEELLERLMHLLVLARDYKIPITLEATRSQQQERLLTIFKALIKSDAVSGWTGLGLSVDTSSKRALPMLAWLSFIAEQSQTYIPVRLIKGAFRGEEIIRAQRLGLSDYPIYTEQQTIETAHQVCTNYLLSEHSPYLLHQQPTDADRGLATAVKIPNQPLQAPIPKPDALYSGFPNAPGITTPDLETQQQALLEQVQLYNQQQRVSAPVINGAVVEQTATTDCYSPYQHQRQTGSIISSKPEDIREAYSVAQSAFPRWRSCTVQQRAQMIDTFAARLTQHAEELISLCILESGMTLPDAIDEVRSAINSCHFYSYHAQQLLTAQPLSDGQQIHYEGLGVITCISAADSPLALYLSQIIVALLAGNTVLAKPDSSTSLIAFRAVELLIDSGIPQDVFSLVPGHSNEIGTTLIMDYRLAGIAFCGSARTANIIAQQRLQNPHALLAPMIATLRCQTVALTDTTIPAEEITGYIIDSAFLQAPIAALKVVYIPQSILDDVVRMLTSRLDRISIATLETPCGGIGPLTDLQTLQAFHGHVEQYRQQGQLLYERPTETQNEESYLALPVLIKLASLEQFNNDCSGPILHLIPYADDTIERVIDELNRTDTPVSLELRSNNRSFIEYLTTQARVASLRVNSIDAPGTPMTNRAVSHAITGGGARVGDPGYLTRFTRLIHRSAN